MGQRAPALVYGVQNPPEALLDFRDTLEWDDAPCMDSDASPPVMGFYVACGGSGEDGVPDLPQCPLADIPTVLAKSITSASGKWVTFLDAAQKAGVQVNTLVGCIHLTETETA